MMKKIAIFPGSFDPITNGHIDIVERALPLFDEIIIAIGVNTQKKYLFPLEDRVSWIKTVFQNEPKIKVEHYSGLTINYCKQKQAQYILRGIRSSADFEYEKTIAHLNHTMQPNIETILILSKAELSSVSSTIVREIILGHGDVSKFIPQSILESVIKSI
ncbi:MAG: pantetheine-phosphate adenylyltransferase [Chitinophagales bacterium]|nr:pantetheine-phosphate adenylyltransferase [Chitinophagales bacterium]MCZ2393338.1 pantetheine-phosphate adenylyltransferase [Chitinophagales bacterium]